MGGGVAEESGSVGSQPKSDTGVIDIGNGEKITEVGGGGGARGGGGGGGRETGLEGGGGGGMMMVDGGEATECPSEESLSNGITFHIPDEVEKAATMVSTVTIADHPFPSVTTSTTPSAEKLATVEIAQQPTEEDDDEAGSSV